MSIMTEFPPPEGYPLVNLLQTVFIQLHSDRNVMRIKTEFCFPERHQSSCMLATTHCSFSLNATERLCASLQSFDILKEKQFACKLATKHCSFSLNPTEKAMRITTWEFWFSSGNRSSCKFATNKLWIQLRIEEEHSAMLELGEVVWSTNLRQV